MKWDQRVSIEIQWDLSGSKGNQGGAKGSQGEQRGTKESQGEPRRARWHQLQSILISQKNIPNFLFVNDDFLNLVDWSMLLSTFCCMAPYQGLAAINAQQRFAFACYSWNLVCRVSRFGWVKHPIGSCEQLTGKNLLQKGFHYIIGNIQFYMCLWWHIFPLLLLFAI